MVKRQINVLGERPTVAELLDYYGRDETGKGIGFFKATADYAIDISTNEEYNGYLFFVPDAGLYIVHRGFVYSVPAEEMALFHLRGRSEKRRDILGTHFMLYQALEDILKIDRFDMADHEHDESFKFAQEVLNKCKTLTV